MRDVVHSLSLSMHSCPYAVLIFWYDASQILVMRWFETFGLITQSSFFSWIDIETHFVVNIMKRFTISFDSRAKVVFYYRSHCQSFDRYAAIVVIFEEDPFAYAHIPINILLSWSYYHDYFLFLLSRDPIIKKKWSNLPTTLFYCRYFVLKGYSTQKE